MNVYETVTQRIVALLEQGTVPWRKPWRGGPGGIPRNLVSGKPYRGINVALLGCQDWDSPWWLTFKQARDLDGHIRKGEKGTPVVLWKWLELAPPGGSAEDETERFPMLRYYTVFNLEQCEGVSHPAATPPTEPNFNPIDACEAVVSHMPNPPTIERGGDHACYRPGADLVNIPPPHRFDAPAGYYSTLLHELVHSTGHPSRLARKGITELEAFGSHTYSREELVAEFGASFLCVHCGIVNATIDNNAAYIDTWLGRLNSDKALVVVAAAQAQKAADFILDRHPETEGATGGAP